MATNKDFIVKNGLQVGGDIVVTGSLQTSGLTLPASDGTSGQVIVTDGSGNLSFQSVTTNAFSRIEVNGQTTITTDQVGDTLSFVAGDNITITTDEPNDAITISASQYTDAEAVDAVEAAEHLTIDGGTLYVDTANNYVGIGDTSPQHKLDVAGGIGINGTEVIDTSGEIVTAQLKNSGVTAGSYGSASEVPVITVDAKGRVTSASTTAVAGVESVTYNASGSEALRINTSDGGQQSVSLALGGSLVGPLDDITITYSATEPASPSQGTFYFDSLNQKMKVYTGSAWIDAVPAGTGGGEGGETTDAVATMEKFQYTITSTTNAVSGSDDNSNTLSYIVDGSQNIEVFVNGIKQFEGATNDYVATTGSSVTFTYNLEQDDVVDVQVYELLTQDAFYLKSETFTKTETNTQIANAVNSYLPLTGGTLTGDLVTTGLTVDGTTLVVDKLNNRVGIGTAAPLRNMHVVGTFACNAGAGQYYGVYMNGAGEGGSPSITIGDWHNDSATIQWESSNNLLRIDSQYSSSANPIVFSGNDGATEYARFTSSSAVFNENGGDVDFRVESDSNQNMFHVDAGSGYVSIGSTSAGSSWRSTDGVRFMGYGHNNYGYSEFVRTSDNDTSANIYIARNNDGRMFSFNTQSAEVGSVTITTSGTTYNTTSDRRLKDNITTITNGKEKLLAMNPVTHTWKADPNTGETVHGFIAQEMQQIVPEAVSGDPDSDKMMSMDYGRITPVIVAALQDALKEIEELKERIKTLEAK